MPAPTSNPAPLRSPPSPAPRWSQGLPDGGAARGEDFYTDAGAQRLYKNYVRDIVGRVNTFTGVAYR